ncbi:hypothetical protein SEUCBS139899_006314 [Sporothrix eucalyptigena]|uniref:RTA1 domain protein n=1 Tax=Sporothrix eucalyptigena TaxID=1812306 RepID=A0ABP0CRR0_9PEZI
MPTLQMFEGKVYLWKYIPSLPLAISFLSVFLVVTVAHLWKMVRTKLWFCTPFVLGGVFEVIGYVNRAAAYNATGSLIPYLLQSLFLLLAPIFFAATLYMVYSRIVRAVHGERLSLIPPRWTTRIFVLLDLTFLSVQSNGGGLLAKTKTARLGSYIVVAGLILQVLGFLGFMACCIVFHRRFAASQRHRRARQYMDDAEQPSGNHHLSDGIPVTSLPWQSVLYMLYATSVAILARNLFRIVEFIMGTDGYLQAHEWPVYSFDGGLMLIVMLVFFIWHPSTLRPAGGTDAIEQRESMIELTGNETAFGSDRGRERSRSSGTQSENKSRFELEDWFWPSKVWSLAKKTRRK